MIKFLLGVVAALALIVAWPLVLVAGTLAAVGVVVLGVVTLPIWLPLLIVGGVLLLLLSPLIWMLAWVVVPLALLALFVLAVGSLLRAAFGRPRPLARG